MTTSLAIAIDDVCFRYTQQDKNSGLVIKNWSLASKQRCFLYGPSGCGKSTFLNLLSGILVPQQGSVKLLGQPFSSLRAAKRDRFRAKHLGVIFQQFNLVPYLSVKDNVLLAQYFAGNGSHSTSRLDEILEKLKLPEAILSQRADQISIGQQQRVAIARALINEPQIIIADEPTSALDEDATDEFMSLLIESSDLFEAALVFVSHDKRLSQYFDINIAMSQLNHNQQVAAS